MIVEFIRRFMYGRYGNDQLNKFLLIISLLFATIWCFFKLNIISAFVIVITSFCYFRMFSRDIAKRQEENTKFLQIYANKKKKLRDAIWRFKDRKEHKYFKCTVCKAYLRVPRGRGKISIHCPNCGNEFIKKS